MRSPIEISALNLLVPGVGYMVVGKKVVGAFVLITCLLAAYLWLEQGADAASNWIWMCSIVGMIDGYIQGAKMRDGGKR